MNAAFALSALVAVAATAMVITRRNAVHALLYLVVSLLAVALVFYSLGAPFVAALEVIVYAGAIVVLFVFVVMMLGLAPPGMGTGKRPRLAPWLGTSLLCLLLAAELVGLLGRHASAQPAAGTVGADQVGIALYGPYVVGVELASMLLLGALVGAHHLGRRRRPEEEEHDGHFHAARPDSGGDPVRPRALRPDGAAQPDLRAHVP